VAEFLEKQILWWILMKAWLPACRLAGLVNAGLCHYEGLQFAKNHQLC
jgi:hypothetical protein